MPSAGGLFTYSYDAVGRTSKVINPSQHSFTLSYDAAGQLTRIEKPVLQLTTQTFDAAGRLMRIFNGNGASLGFANNAILTYTYDNVGSRLTAHEATVGGSINNLTTYTYDNTYQLTREQRSGTQPYDLEHTFDRVGNRLEEIDHVSGGITTYAYDVANQLQVSDDAVGTAIYQYDQAGNLINFQDALGAVTTSVWDDENRRTKVLLPSGVINTSVYNGEGLRVEKQDSTGVTKFIWDFQNYLAELDAANANKFVYTQTADTYGRLLGRKGTSQFTLGEFYEYDALGSVTRVITTGTGTSNATFLYTAFGKTTRLSGTIHQPFAWVGQLGYYYDVDLLEYYLRARQYSPALARFLSQDPIGFAAGDVNLFRYVRNDPINVVDPSGLLSFWVKEALKKCNAACQTKFPCPKGPAPPELIACLAACAAAALAWDAFHVINCDTYISFCLHLPTDTARKACLADAVTYGC